MNLYHKAIEELKTKKTYTIQAHGKSMEPMIKDKSTLTFVPSEEYEVGDVVFCKVRGRFITAHKIVKKDKMGGAYRYQIANYSGHINGWTRQVYGKVVKVVPPKT